METRSLRYITTLARTGNFTKAAKELYISQPSLSAFVAKLEAEYGVVLFDRNASPLVPTYAGEIFIKRAEEILAVCDLLEKELGDVSEQKVGRIRVGVPPERAAYMLPLLIPVYREQYPQVDVQITTDSTSHLIDMLRANKLDMAILPDTGWGKEFVRNTIYAEEIVLADGGLIEERHLMEGLPHVVDLSSLTDLPVYTQSPRHGIRRFIDALCAEREVTLTLRETTSNMSAYRLASAGMGTAIVPRMTAEITKEAGEARLYSLSAAGVRWEIDALQRKDAYVSALEKAFIVTARRIFSARP